MSSGLFESQIVVKQQPGKKLTPAQKKLLARQEAAALRIQTVIRRVLAVKYVKEKSRRIWQRVFDPRFKLYFWYNKANGQSQWIVPKNLDLFTDVDEKAACILQRYIRGFVGKMRAKKVVYSIYTRFYDSKVNKYYWLNGKTNATTWKASKWLIRQNVPMPPEDVMLYEATMKIRELELKLLEKEKEIITVRAKRYEELEPEVLKDRLGDAKLLVRSKHLDEWSVDEVAAMLTELKMNEYVEFVQKNKVDGNLFINLSDDDWTDMGIINKFHRRKLQLYLKSFRTRYENKQNRIGDDDDLMSEYAPSEVSDLVRAEEGANFGKDDGDDGGYNSESSYSSEEERIELTEEQKLEKQMDEENVHIEKVINGDGMNFPMIGDVVRVRYVCIVISNNKVVTSTKNGIKRNTVEFVLGMNHIIKGLDRALPKMSIGERSRVSMTAEYAYGKDGLFPHIAPNCEIKFDITLLGYRPRVSWVKPLIQEPGLSQKPYVETKQSKDARYADDTGDDNSID